MNSVEPDISQINNLEIKERNFPLNLQYRITISNHAFESISNHASENNSVEICGVLIGDVYKDADGPFLEISDIIKGEHADNQAGEVKFTHETWSHIHGIKDAIFAEKQIVGWYHSHPRFGIFLSDQDMFIHQNFFNQPWQVAFVIDPISNDYGFFIWHKGIAVLCNYFWIDSTINDRSKIANGSQTKIFEKIDSKIEVVSKLLRRVVKPYQLIIGFLILVVLLFINYALINNNFNNLLNPIKQSIINEQIQNADDIKQILSQNNLLSGLEIKILRKKNNIWCLGKVYTLHQKELIEKIVGSLRGIESVDMQGVISSYRYMVLPGETLSEISTKIYGSSNRWKNIYELNTVQIKDPNKILPNINLILPE